MNIKQSFIFGIIYLIYTGVIQSQMSPDTKYKKVDSKHYEIIFPDTMQGQIGTIAAQLDKSYEYINQSLGLKNDYKISIILNNKKVYSNAFVTLAPEYSMFYTLPPQLDIHQLYYDDWIKLLSVHEMRHAAQFHKLNYGFNRVLYFIFGDIGLAAGVGLSTHGWFMEGDAVFMETALTDYGRGRIPYFSMLTRSMLLSDEIPDYAQMYLGSDLKVYPEIREFGYLMTAWLRQNYGNDIFDKILAYSSSWNVLTGPYAFHLGVYYKTGKSLFENYQEMMMFLSERWKSDLKKRTLTDFDKINTQKKHYYTDYTRPQSVSGSGEIYFYKKGKFHRGSIVKITPSGREKVLCFTGNLSGTISVNKNSIVWSEEQPDIRWSESTSVLKWYDIETGIIRKIKTGGRIFAPSISSDDKLLTGMQVDPDGNSFLVIFDKNSAAYNMITKVQAPKGSLWQTPRFGSSLEKIAFVESTAEGKSIVTYDIGKKQLVRNLRPIKHQISDPYIFRNYILFHSDIKGIDNIFALNIETGEIKQVSSVTLGAFYPNVSVDGSYIYFSNFSRLGSDIARMPWQPEKWINVTDNDLEPSTLFANTDTSKDQATGSIFQGLPEATVNVTDYSQFANFLNFHSRYIDPFNYLLFGDINIGLISGNKLQTHFIDLFYTYRTLENSHKAGAAWTFMGWYPIISLGGIYGNRNYVDLNQNRFSWVEKSAYLDFTLPFYISRGPVSQNVYVGARTSASAISNFVSSNSGYPTGISMYNADWYAYYNFKINGNPRLFDNPYFIFGFYTYNTPKLPFFNQSGSALYESAHVTIPGFLNDNIITIRGSGSQNSGGFDPLSVYPVYTQSVTFYDFSDEYILSINYSLPLIYPDLNIFHILYFRQIRLNAFYEHFWVKPFSVPENFVMYKANYVGGDLLLKFNIFELKSDITGGIRIIYDPQLNTIQIRPILWISVSASF